MQDEPPPAGVSSGRFTTPSARNKTAADTGYRETAKSGHAISQRITTSEVAAVRGALAQSIPERLGVTEEDLRAFVRGDLDIVDLPRHARDELSAIAAATPRAGLWPRKLAAILWGLHLEQIQVP